MRNALQSLFKVFPDVKRDEVRLSYFLTAGLIRPGRVNLPVTATATNKKVSRQ